MIVITLLKTPESRLELPVVVLVSTLYLKRC